MAGQGGQGSTQENRARPGQRRMAQWTRDYARLPGIPDEFIAQDGTPRAVWARFFDAFATLSPPEIERRFGAADRHLRDAGVTYRAPGESAELEIFPHGQLAEHAAPLRHQRKSGLDDLVRRQAVERLAGEPDRADLVVQGAAHAVDERAFAGAVGADQAEALARLHVQVDALQRDEAAEALSNTSDLKERAHDAGPGSLNSRRYNCFTP